MNISAKTYFKMGRYFRRVAEQRHLEAAERRKLLNSQQQRKAAVIRDKCNRVKKNKTNGEDSNTKSFVIYRLIEQLLILQSYGTLFSANSEFL